MEEKNRKKQKLTEALEDLRMEFIEEAVQPDAQASYGAKVPKNHPVLRWVLIAAAAVLLVGVMFTASILGNIAWKRSHPAGASENSTGPNTASPVTSGAEVTTVPEEPTVEPEAVEATLQYTSNGDGTCYVSGILNPTGADKLLITVPSSYNGETVTAYQPENLIFPIFYFCEKEEFEHWLDVFAEGINQVSRETIGGNWTGETILKLRKESWPRRTAAIRYGSILCNFLHIISLLTIFTFWTNNLRRLS